MNHKENYAKLLNTLSNIETKGNNTIIVADCMKFLAQCVQECEQHEGAVCEVKEGEEA